MGFLKVCVPKNDRRWNCKIEKQDIKDEFARLGHRSLIIHCLLVVGEQGAVPEGAGQSGQKFEVRGECGSKCPR
jgi:hypothetical protein